MNANTAQMHHLTLRFADTNLEAVFGEEQARKALKPFRVGVLCVAGVMVIVWLLMDKLLPQIAGVKALLRHGFVLTARGAVEVEGKGEMRTFLLLPANNNIHSAEGARL